MAEDVLSQSEIDKLLAAFSSGDANVEEMKAEENKPKVKVYDFKRPDKFSKDQIRTLEMLHENFARMLNTYLSGSLRCLVNVEVASVEQTTYREFIQSLANPSVIGILAVPPLRGSIIMEVDTSIAFAIIDRVFGGQGDGSIKSRMLTEIEEAVMRRFYSRTLTNFKDAWTNVVSFNPELEGIESNPQFAQIAPPSDMVVIITIQLKVGAAEGFMTICMPYLVVEPIMSKLTTTFWVSANAVKEENPEHSENIDKHLKQTVVPMVVRLGEVDITVREYLSLNFGDVLKLNSLVEDDLHIKVGSNTKFLCRPGTSGKKLAVQITEVVGAREEEKDE